MPVPRAFRRFLSAALLALAVLPAHALRTERFSAPAAQAHGAKSLEVASGSALVRFKTGISTAAAASGLSSAGFAVRNYLPGLGWAEVELPAGMAVTQGVSLLQASGLVDAAAPNRVFRPSRVPNDPFAGSQYALSRIEAFGAWEYWTGASDLVTVAMIDTGIENTHPDLHDKLIGTSMAFADNGASSVNEPPTAACNHGTRSAGVAAASADNSQGIAGMSWGARLISLKVFDPLDCTADCSSRPGRVCGTTEVAIAAAIDNVRPLHGGSLGKVIVNMSLGSVGGCSGPLQTAVTNAVNAGLMLFAAAGNEGAVLIDSPANCDGVIAVGATDAADNLAAFSNIDNQMKTTGIAAPGVEVYTTDVGGGYAPASGTSFSSPMAAGLAALLWSAKPAAFPAAGIRGYIMDSADDLGDPGPDREFGRGRINALKAMRLALNKSDDYKGAAKAVAYPNPFRPRLHRLATITVPDSIRAGNTEIRIYTSEGELVRKLDTLAWDGRNDAGADAASGIYLFRVKTDKDLAVGRLALIR